MQRQCHLSVIRAGLYGQLTSLISLRQFAADAATDWFHRRSVRFLVAPGRNNYASVPPVAPSNRTDRFQFDSTKPPGHAFGLAKAEVLFAFAETERASRLNYMARSRRQGRTPPCPPSPP